MTDSRLQHLKRAWEASGSVEDEAAYLRERVRAGELSQERLELAAFLGDRPSQLLFPDELLLSLPQVATLTLLRVSQVRKWLKKGCPAASKQGRDSTFEARALFLWLTSGQNDQPLLWVGYRLLGALLGAKVQFAGLRASAAALSRVLDRGGGFEHFQGRLEKTKDWLACPCADHEQTCRSTALEVLGHFVLGTWDPDVAMRYNDLSELLNEGAQALALQAAGYDGPVGEGVAAEAAFRCLAFVEPLEPPAALRLCAETLLPWLLEGEKGES